MLKEFVQVMIEHFTQERLVVPKRLDFSRDPQRFINYWDPELKTVVEVELDRRAAVHNFLNLDSLIKYVDQLGDASKNTNVWVGENRIVIECEEYSNKDLPTLKLIKHPLFELLEELDETPSRAQAEAIKLLRQDLRAFDPGSKALTVARSIKTNTTIDQSAEQQHLAAMVGKAIVQKAVGAESLPEYLTVKAPVYMLGDVEIDPVAVDLYLSPDFSQTGRLMMEPDATAMHEGQQKTIDAIADYICERVDETRVVVYRGEYAMA